MRESGAQIACRWGWGGDFCNWQQVPQVSIAQTYLKIMNKFAEQFGLTPSSRSRIIASDGGPADAADEIAYAAQKVQLDRR